MNAAAIDRGSRPLRSMAGAEGAAFAIVVASLCLTTGVHAALATMHWGNGTAPEFTAFAFSALASALCLLAVVRRHRAGELLTSVVLVGFALVYALSRNLELPVLGRDPVDPLGIATLCVELAGAAAAVLLASRAEAPRPTIVRRVPQVVCVLVLSYGFLLAYALPTVHHADQHLRHGHAHAH